MHWNRRCYGFEILESRRLLASVDIPDDLSGAPGTQVLTPVNIDDAVGVRGAEIQIHYDTSVLDVTAAGVLAGSVWPEGAEVVANVDDAAGTIDVFVFVADALASTSGSLVNIQFTVRSDAMVGSVADIDLVAVELNEGEISLDVVPQPGADPTDGQITVASGPPTGNASVSGFVFADTNTNNQVDSLEGLPGITVVLVNLANDQETEAETQVDGRFEFLDLVPGSYRLEQQQPAAYLDGGPNEIAVTLASGQDLTDQNFRERGLRPEFVYNRLFTTLVMPIGSPEWIAVNRQIILDGESGVVGSFASSTQSITESEQPSETAPASAIPEGESPSTHIAGEREGNSEQQPLEQTHVELFGAPNGEAEDAPPFSAGAEADGAFADGASVAAAVGVVPPAAEPAAQVSARLDAPIFAGSTFDNLSSLAIALDVEGETMPAGTAADAVWSGLDRFLPLEVEEDAMWPLVFSSSLLPLSHTEETGVVDEILAAESQWQAAAQD